MIDLHEARKSFDFYAALLDLHCSMYHVVSRANERAKQLSVEPSNSQEEIVAELIRRQREALSLGAMVSEEIGKRAPDLLDEPDDLAEALQAQSRMVIAVNKATTVIEEHRQAQATKDRPPSATQLALDEFLKKYRSQQKLSASLQNPESEAPDA